MNVKTLCGALAASLFLSVSGVQAAPVYIKSPVGQVSPSTDGFTGILNGLFANWVAKSTYAEQGTVDGVVAVGDLVTDTVVKDYSAGATSFKNRYGDIALDPTVLGPGGIDYNEGYGQTWSLYFNYEIQGEVDGVINPQTISANYTSGFISVYYDDFSGFSQVGNVIDYGRDLAEANRLMTIAVGGSGVTGTGILLFGQVVDVVDDHFFFENGVDFDSLVGTDIAISARIDANLDPQSLIAPTPRDGVLSREAALDGSVIFNVPEPGALALLGLGLVGLGLARRSKKQAS